MDKNNIILIGMPGAGKSTIGVVLAKMLRMDFCDTDLIIQKNTGRALQEIIDNDGLDYFLECECKTVTELGCENCVIATGGSVVLKKEAIEHLRALGNVIYLRATFDKIESRIHNIDTRGIAFKEGQTLFDIYNQRTPLYENACDFIVDVGDFNPAITCEKIKEKVNVI